MILLLNQMLIIGGSLKINLVNKLNDLEDKLLDIQVEKEAIRRVQQKNYEVYLEKEVLGPNGLSDVNVDNDDGWE